MKKLVLSILTMATLGASAQTTVSSTPNLSIPDNNATGASDIIALTSGGTITNLKVTVDISHSWVGDLIITLNSPSGTTITLADRVGVPASTAGCSLDDFIATFNDASGNVIETACPPNGTYQPESLLSNFTSESINGNWTLKVSDNAGGDFGVINSWSLIYNSPPPLDTIYINHAATGNDDGSSWTNAHTSLSIALNSATIGQEFWVADGTYTTGGTNRSAAFGWTVDSIEVYGGFNGTETLLSQRDWIANKTILSGDIGVLFTNSDNNYSVFAGPIGNSSNVLEYGKLDGFVIQDANANVNGNGFGAAGAGVYMADYAKKLVINNCEISNNRAKLGTAIHAEAINNDKELVLSNCIIKNNEGRWGVGTHVRANNNSMVLKVSNCLYYENTVTDMGSLGDGTNSIIYVESHGASPQLDIEVVNSTFSENNNTGTHINDNEGLFQYYSSTSSGTKNLKVYNTIFWGNTGDTATIVHHPTSVGSYNNVEFHNCISDFTDFSDATATSNILNSEPLFTNTTASDFTLQSGSPAIDAGIVTGLSIPTIDLAGNARVVGSQIDLGCYEKPAGLGFNETTQKLDLTIYPNPVTSQLNIDNGISTSINDQIKGITILDITGKTVKTIVSGVNEVDVSDLTKGIYFVQIRTEKGLVNKKFVKE